MRQIYNRLTVIALLLISGPVYATESIIFSGSSDLFSTSTTEYHGLQGPAPTAGNNTSGRNDGLASSAGTIKNLRVRVNTAPGLAASGKSWTFTVRLNEADSIVTCTISETATSCSDTTNTVAIAAGDRLDMSVNPAATPTTTDGGWSVTFDSTTANESLITGSLGGDTASNGLTSYLPLGGVYIDSTTEANRQFVIPAAGTIKKLHMRNSAVPGAGTSYTYTVRKNGVDQTLTCLVDNAGGATCSDTTNSFTVAAGDKITLKSVPAGTPTAARVRFGVTFVSDTAGDFIVGGPGAATLDTASTFYGFMASGGNAWSATESTRYTIGQTTATIKKIYVVLGSTPGAGKSYVFTLRQNAVDSALVVTLSDSETSDNAAVNVSVADLDYFSIKSVPSGTPTASLAAISFLVSSAVGGGGGRTRRFF